jgi:TonB family protein
MRRFYLAPLLLVSCFLFAQDTISVDAISAMHVCTDKTSGPCVTPPQALSNINPTYPEKARRARREGTVGLSIIVAKDGSVRDIRVTEGQGDDLNGAAIAAVSQWRFEPGTYEGEPVDVEIRLHINFRLEQKASATQGQGATANTEDVRNLFADAKEAYSRQDYQMAAKLARRVVNLSPQNSTGWNLLGMSLANLNQLDAAADAMNTAIKADPGTPYAYNDLGRVLWRQRKYEEAATQFRKQIVINPQDHYAHGNLGILLSERKKCSEALPELEKTLSLTPGRSDVLLAEGKCDIDQGNRAKGVSELEQATSTASAPNVWNGAAYILAERNIELEHAEKWSETSLSMESSRLRSISFDHLTSEQLNFVLWIANYWDTRGWIYFLRGDTANARAYAQASWQLLPLPTMGDHLGQIYEKAGQREDAIRTYAMAVAAVDRPTRSSIDDDDVADAKQRLAKLDPNVDRLLARGRTDLASMGEVLISNASKINGTGDFALSVRSGEKPLQVRKISGDASLSTFTEALRSARIPIEIPQIAGVEIPLRGTLTCRSDEPQCHFALLTAEAAVEVAKKEAAIDSPALAETPAVDPHVYNNLEIGMRVSLPDEWKMIKDDPGSFSRPHNVMFGKPGGLGYFMLTREHLESTPELYEKMLESGLSQQQQFKRTGEQKVTRDGLTGTRWSATWNENGEVAYSSVMEFFTVGDDHYRVTALAPKEVYDRYAETFENMFRSVQFPLLHADPRMLESVK